MSERAVCSHFIALSSSFSMTIAVCMRMCDWMSCAVLVGQAWNPSENTGRSNPIFMQSGIGAIGIFGDAGFFVLAEFLSFCNYYFWRAFPLRKP